MTGSGYKKAARYALIAAAGSVALDWWEWKLHHPPNMVFVAIIHFVFLLIVTAAVCYGIRGVRAARRRR